MNKNVLIKKIVSLLVLITIFASMMPNFVFAYESGNLAGISNWSIKKSSGHSTITTSGNGVRIAQTKQTLKVGGKKNGNTNEYELDFSKTEGTDDRGFSVSAGGYTGNITLTIKYSTKNDDTAGNGAFYQLNIPGFAHVRIKEDSVSVMNSSSGDESDVENGSFTYSRKPNSAGTENTLVFNINTETNKFTATLNNKYSSTEANSWNVNLGKEKAIQVNKIEIVSMERMEVGSYLDISSVVIADDSSSEPIVLDDATQAIIDSLPDKLADDPSNVTEDITLPWQFENIRWDTSYENVMNNLGKIQRLSDADPKDVQIRGTFEGTTTKGESIMVTVKYDLVVTGLNDRVKNTATVGKSVSDAKWYTPPERNGVEDGYPILGDPNYISDEAFFGKWDSANSKWTLKPFFNYEDYSGLSDVESCAKAGNYDGAKEAIKEYYANNFDKKATKASSLSTVNNVLYEMVSRNAYPTNVTSGFPINYFYVDKAKSEVNVDVTTRFKQAYGSFTHFSTMVVSVDKYKSPTVIYSSESTTPPVLVFELKDGTTEELEAKNVYDSYIQGGAYKDVNYGDATELLVEEAGVHNNFEDRTKRAFINFDISGLDYAKADIDKVYVKLTAKNDLEDDRMLLLYWYKDSSWDEYKVCFNTFTDYLYFSCNDMVCWDYVTSNSPSIKGKVCGYHRGSELGDICELYSYYESHENPVADFEKYAYTCIRQYMGLINSLGVEYDVMNSLDLARHMSTASQDFLRLINSEYMTPEIFTAFLKHLWLLAEQHIYECYGTKDNNWATFSTSGVYSICARYPEFARYNTWMDATKEENERVTKGFTFEDGMSLELSQGYTDTLLDTFDEPYTVKEVTGTELPYDDATVQIIHDLVMSLCKQVAPGFGGFGFGDSTNPYTQRDETITKWYNRLFKGDPMMAYVGTQGKKGWMPENATTNYPSGLRTFMRSDWSNTALAMGITNKMVGSHGHKDALSLSMYAYGKFLLVDPGYGAALTGNIRDYMISPQQHNTVTVNDYTNYLNTDNTINPDVEDNLSKIAEVDGKEECFDSNMQYDFVEYSTTAYTQTDLSQRSVTFLKNQKMWIVTDYIVPKNKTAETVYTQNWHMNYDSKMSIDDNKIIRSNTKNSPNVMVVPVAPTEIDSAEKVKTLFSAQSGQFLDSHKAVLKKTKAGETTFSTIIIPMAKGEDFTVTTEKLSTSLDATAGGKINAFRFTVTNTVTGEFRKFLYYHLNDATLTDTVKVDAYTTDAQTLLVEEYSNGFVKSMYMVNGTYVKKSSTEIFRTTEETSASFIRNDDKTVLDYSVSGCDAKEALENVTFHQTLADTVTYNGVEYGFDVVDGKITFTNVETYIDPTYDPKVGTVIYDSAVNPELLTKYLIEDDDHHKATYNLGEDGIKFETIKTTPQKADGSPNGTTEHVGLFRFNGIYEDIVNNTKTVTNLMSGKYAVELTLQHSIDTERTSSTFSTITFGNGNETLDGIKDSFVEFRLRDNTLAIIRTAKTQKDYIRKDLSNVSLQSLEDDKEWKLRVVFDTINKTYSVFVNDQYDPNASNFPYNVNSESINGVVTWTEKLGNFVPDLSITMMDANTVGSYVWVKNVKLYEIESNENDPRILAVNELIPAKLYAGDVNKVDSSLNIPKNDNVTWTSSDTTIFDNDGELKKKVTALTPVTFTAVGTFNDTEETGRVFDFTKVYNMSVLTTNSWTMSATKNGNDVSASVSCETENYGSQPLLIIAGYNAKGAVCDMHVKKVSEKLTDYKYTVKNDPKTTKVFLLDNFNSAKPLAKSVVFN